MASKRQISDKALELSNFTDGDGIEILQIAYLALTDVNYHPEAKIHYRMAEALDNNVGAEFEFQVIE